MTTDQDKATPADDARARHRLRARREEVAFAVAVLALGVLTAIGAGIRFHSADATLAVIEGITIGALAAALLGVPRR